MKLNPADIEQLQSRYRATLINSISGVRSAVLVGTRSISGVTNLAIFNSLVHLGADPPINGLVFRPATVERHTLTNILDSGSYTLNFVSANLYKKAHQTSAKYPSDQSEFDSAGFNCLYSDDIYAPFVGEAIIRLAMRFHSRIEIPANGTIFVIGTIEQIFIPDDLVSSDGFVAPDHAELLTCAGLDAYFKPIRLGRLTYARPGVTATEI
jgi:flavin reductase (DIM6/NTAB) family NADH-FMN oxidoreductase RutF